MAPHHTHERIIKLARKGLSHDSIARKIGRPGDVERVQEALDKDSELTSGLIVAKEVEEEDK